MNLPALKVELTNLLTSTPNLTATEKQKLRNRCVTLYPEQFQAWLAANTLTDTAANRGAFFIEKTVGNPPGTVPQGMWSNVWAEGSDRENRAAIQPHETF